MAVVRRWFADGCAGNPVVGLSKGRHPILPLRWGEGRGEGGRGTLFIPAALPASHW
jgi:hypothetical protein